ncbi:hypothetical protein PCC9214_03017 [Planktothrix tepida]|uniref:DUF4347 domain-containing protein n=1 Tax=Planktothrix tepida TaxID=1678309 RepID=UPI002205BF14|nr:DUF4347 domain-containing protein [Planktothrix tepida]CAD5958370.1 hypothetical protein PCC9214_03017 [Planktothrix tepida]
MNAQSGKTLIVVDSSVENYQSLVETLPSNAEVMILDATQDGIEQITNALSQHSNIDSIQIVSHGADGLLQLGTTTLTSEALNIYTQSLSKWGESLTPNGDILLLGCNVAASETGKAFVQQLSQVTQADIAASDDLTGNINLGGDWLLEYATGLINAPLAFQIEAMNAYQSVLANFSVSNAVELTNALNQARNNFEPDQITITGNINGFFNSFNLDLQDNEPLSIIGNGNTIDGGNSAQIFTIVNGKIVLSNLILQNGLAKGGDGITGGGGGLGAGGALYVQGGNVTVENVTFTNNQAKGGNSFDGAGRGGSDGNVGAGGGTGGGLNGNTVGVGTEGGGGGKESQGGSGGQGEFGAGGGGAGGGGGGTTAPDQGGNGGQGVMVALEGAVAVAAVVAKIMIRLVVMITVAAVVAVSLENLEAVVLGVLEAVGAETGVKEGAVAV